MRGRRSGGGIWEKGWGQMRRGNEEWGGGWGWRKIRESGREDPWVGEVEGSS